MINLEQYLVSCMYRTHCTEYANMEIEDQYRMIPLLWEQYKNSEYFNKYNDPQVNINCWLDSIDWRFFIECSCGSTEEFSADQPRHHVQFFDWLKNSDLDVTAYYQCPDCGYTVRSEVIPDFEVHYQRVMK